MGKKLLKLVAALAALVAGVVLCAALADVLLPDGSGTDEPTAIEATEEASEETAATDTPLPSPSPALSGEAGLRAAVDAALGESNRDTAGGRKLTAVTWREGEGTVEVTWAADDNFGSLIAAGIRNDAAAVLRAVHESGLPYERVFLAATFALIDSDGRDVEGEVMLASYDDAGVRRLAGRDFPAAGVFDAAATAWLSPVLDE